MTVRRLMNQPLVVQPVDQTTTDEYGNAVDTPEGEGVAEQGYLELSSSVEYTDDRQTTVTKWKAYLWPTSVVTPMSYLTFEAQTFQVDGEPWHAYNPRTRAVDHIECELLAVT